MTDRIRKIGNEGSALIVVIICMLFIGIIASIVLTITSGNLQNINTSSKSSDNFYETEVILDELKTALKSLADEAVTETYLEYFQTYALRNVGKDDDSLADFRFLFATKFKEKLRPYFLINIPDTPGGEPVVDSRTASDLEDYRNLLFGGNKNKTEDENYLLANVTTNSGGVIVTIDDNNVMSIKNIEISYKDQNGNYSTISTDLVFDILKPTISVGANVGVNRNIADFVLIADKTIKNEGNNPITIMGNIYGGGKNSTSVSDPYANGKGIYFNNSGTEGFDADSTGLYTKIFADYIISRSALYLNGSFVAIKPIVSNTSSSLNVSPDGSHADENATAKVWIRDIQMSDMNNPAEVNHLKSNLDIQGVCNVQDDMTIDSNDSMFRLIGKSSEYLGYSANGGTTNTKSSSSISINGKNVKLLLQNAKYLLLAGKSYIDVPLIWGYSNPTDADSEYISEHTEFNDRTGSFQQGESITNRYLQSAYLLPGDCIKGIGHNPMTQQEFMHFYNKETGYGIDIDANFTKDGIRLSNFLKRTRLDTGDYDYSDAYTFQFVKYGSTWLVYVYMNFVNADAAADYFQEYSEKYSDRPDGDLIKTRLDMFGNGQILINNVSTNINSTTGKLKDDMINHTGISHTGNIIYYDYTTSSYKVYFANRSNAEVGNIQSKLDTVYKNLITTLNEKTLKPERNDLTENILEKSEVEKTEIISCKKILTTVKDEGSEEYTLQEKYFEIDDQTLYCTDNTAVRPAYQIVTNPGVYTDDSGNKKNAISVDVEIIDTTAYYIMHFDDGTSKKLPITVDGTNLDWNSGPTSIEINGIRKVVSKNPAGVIIANGDVTVSGSFWGTIIATGNITLEGNSQVYASKSMRELLVSNNNTIFPYFGKNDNGEYEEANPLNIRYENWKKD